MSDEDKVQIANEITKAEKNLKNARDTLKNYGNKFAKFRTYDGLSRGRRVNGRWKVWNDVILEYMELVDTRMSDLKNEIPVLVKYKRTTEGLLKNRLIDWAKESMYRLSNSNDRVEYAIRHIITHYKILMEEIDKSDTRIQKAAQKAVADKLQYSKELRF